MRRHLGVFVQHCRTQVGVVEYEHTKPPSHFCTLACQQHTNMKFNCFQTISARVFKLLYNRVMWDNILTSNDNICCCSTQPWHTKKCALFYFEAFCHTTDISKAHLRTLSSKQLQRQHSSTLHCPPFTMPPSLYMYTKVKQLKSPRFYFESMKIMSSITVGQSSSTHVKLHVPTILMEVDPHPILRSSHTYHVLSIHQARDTETNQPAKLVSDFQEDMDNIGRSFQVNTILPSPSWTTLYPSLYLHSYSKAGWIVVYMCMYIYGIVV